MCLDKEVTVKFCKYPDRDPDPGIFEGILAIVAVRGQLPWRRSAFSECYYLAYIMKKKTLRETQTLRAGCSKAEAKKFTPPQTPFPGARYGQNLIRWR